MNIIIYLQVNTTSEFLIDSTSWGIIFWQLFLLFLLIAVPVLIFRWIKKSMNFKKEQIQLLKEISNKLDVK